MLKQRKGDLDVYSVHSLNTEFEPQLFNLAPRTYLDAERVYRKVLETGRTIGARAYTFHGQARLKRKRCISDPEVCGESALKRLTLSQANTA